MAYNPYSLIHKTIFITGASSGIGKATAIECSKLGAKVIVSGRNEERLNETYSMLEGDGHKTIIADLSKSDEILKLIKSLPQLDGFVSNAGLLKLLPIRFINEEDLNRILQLNSIAPIMMTRHLIKLKKLNNPSSIVFTSSIAGVFNAAPANSMYSASKAALQGFMKNAALELAPKGIRCNTVNPGLVRTSLSELDTLTEEQYDEILKLYPLKRYGQPKDIAFAIIYLLSEASGWVTGTSLLIDGGFTIN